MGRARQLRGYRSKVRSPACHHIAGKGIYCNKDQALDRVEAVRRIQAMEAYDLYWVEEPVKAEDHLGHAAVRRAVSPPIQTGENW